jgi:hypothetical protein
MTRRIRERSERSFWRTGAFHFLTILCSVAVILSWSAGSSQQSCTFCARGVTAAQGSRGASYTISGAITPAPGGSGVTVSLSGPASLDVNADGGGIYTFHGVASGRYAVTPSKDGYEFTPRAQIVTVNSGDVSGVDFTATSVQPTYTISGTINPPSSGSGSTVTLSGTAAATTTADASGNYSFAGLSSGSYAVTPEKPRATFTPAKQAVIINQSDVSGVTFTIAIRGSE